MVEEVYEAIEAIDSNDFDDLKKELGDMLLHIVFHAEMANETSHFDIGDVIYAIQDKLIRRHPHVFDSAQVSDSGEVLRRWEEIKLKEKGRKSVLDGVPVSLPALLKAQRMQEKAAGIGFDWSNWEDCWGKLEEEIGEFREAVQNKDTENSKKEFGDMLFSLVNLGRFFNLDAEDSLRMTNEKFISRFQYMEKALSAKGLNPKDVTLGEMDELWNEAKELERTGQVR